MPQICPHCKENSVEEDGQNIQANLICTSCGAVIEEGTLTTSTDGTAFAFQDRRVVLNAKRGFGGVVRRSEYKTVPEGLKQGLLTIDVLISKFRVSSNLAEESRTLFNTVLRTSKIKFLPIHTKSMIAACCVYVVLRQSDWPISLVNICQKNRCVLEDLSNAFSLMVRAANVKIKQPPIEEVVETNLTDTDLGLEERPDVVKRTIEIIQLASSLWMTTGRSSRPLVVASAFLAWKSLRPERLKVTYSQFCRRMKVDKIRVSTSRLTEITAMLVRLGSQIPWLDGEAVTPLNVCIHLPDILKYSNTLRIESGSKESGAQSEVREEENEFKKFRFAGKKRTREVAARDEEFSGDAEIMDEEIDQYIRTEKEVDTIRQLYEKYDKETK